MAKALDPVASTRTSQTQAGPDAERGALIEAINEAFAVFRVNYHNQYYKAYPDKQALVTAKKLWLSNLQMFSAQVIQQAAQRAIRECEFLPTIHKMLELCAGASNLPDARAAYMEACNAPSPKSAFDWSHAAVYHAGKASNWFFLAGNPEKVAFPVFAAHYEKLCQRVLNGEELPVPELPKLEEKTGEALTREENAKRLAALRADLEI
ncbi:replication protein P [Biformimicrobium ophioploci]|uniref:Replicative helicase inhibitor G39P N-terminal domain-containing protein n=1 Tax=Biformimicrobium ophioploci TaxID=3036711 RepID=A0ABQ6M167_9GAMM|nr:replication protein P [Microbulbifer sp. NKW57]GMG88010.1 hypothetical protein MNKW57_23310 [Microbulbifer sp. NKW57]